MADKQDEVALQPATIGKPRTKVGQTAEERRIRDALEDDDVREALKLLRAGGKDQRNKKV